MTLKLICEQCGEDLEYFPDKGSVVVLPCERCTYEVGVSSKELGYSEGICDANVDYDLHYQRY